MKNRNWLWFIIVLILVIVIVFLLDKQYNWSNKNKYVATYLTTGELYFGQKSGWTGFNLKNAWLLNKDADNKYNLQEFSQAAWKPVGVMHLAKDKIVFWTNIDESSDIAKLIKGEKKASDIQQTQATTPNTNSSQNSSTQ